jgi:hypothetical protein
MKTKRHFLFIVLACLAGVYQVTAQGTALSYQGRLNDNGSPANGLYDVRFMVWDAATNGNLVAGPLTHSATGVTNGLFAVMLDFGNGLFTGPARWLQLDVRTNGNGAFTTLLPFQQILPMPYAIFANTASNLLGTLSAAQLSGTFTGNGSGLTNVQGSAIVGSVPTANTATTTPLATNLANIPSAYLEVQASAIPFNNNWRMGSWTNTLSAIKNKHQVRMQLDGTGLLGFGLLDGAWSNLLGVIPFAGVLNGQHWFSEGAQGAAVYSSGKDGYWYTGYIATTNINGTNQCWGQMPFAWDVLEVDTSTDTNGSTWQLQTNTHGGVGYGVYGDPYGNADLAVQSTKSVTLSAKSVYWTNSAGPQRITPQFISTSAGTNRFLSIGVWNSKLTNGIIVGYQNQSSSHPADELAISNQIISVLYSNWNPNIILWESPESVTTIEPLTNWIAFYQSACPSADIVICGEYPWGGATLGYTNGDVELGQNAMELSYAQQYGVAYFDGASPFVNDATRDAMGFAITNSDVHPTATGAAAYGYFLSRFLDLNKW